MRPLFLALLVLLLAHTCLAQTPQVTYFNKSWKKVASADKARYSRTVTTSADGITTTEERDLKNDRLIRRETSKGDEPWGRRTYGSTVVDYSFPLVYDEAVCMDSIAGLKSFFLDDNTLGYKAPVVANGRSFQDFLNRNLIYPDREREEGISGRVDLAFAISEAGVISDIHVTKSSGSVGLDKEAVRVVQLLRLQSGPVQNGRTRSLCVRQPVTFRLD